MLELSTFTLVLICSTLSGVSLIVYHHVGYPLILRYWQSHQRSSVTDRVSKDKVHVDPANLPRISIVIPACNEQQWIADKIRNLACFDYPMDRLQIIIACDGCTDNTLGLAQATANEPECQQLPIKIINFPHNRGKVAILNQLIRELDCELVALSDVSALISIDALQIAAECFQDTTLGVLNGHYRLLNPGSKGEAAYWQYQSQLKATEAAWGSTLGAHGAFYLFRRALFTPLPADTINDDFILPMQIVAAGYRAGYDLRIRALELECANTEQDQQRRRRIAAGNCQQLWRLKHMLLPRYGGVAFTFMSGKGLRVLMPFLMLITFCSSLVLALQYPLFAWLAASQLLIYTLAGWQMAVKPKHSPRYCQVLAYIVSGHIAGLLGSLSYLYSGARAMLAIPKDITITTSKDMTMPMTKNTMRAMIMNAGKTAPLAQHYTDTDISYIHPVVKYGKRYFDVFFAIIGLLLLLPILPLIVAAIKLDSKGPVIYRQTRMGRTRLYPEQTDWLHSAHSARRRTNTFKIIKFRSMYSDAENDGIARVAAQHDSRITPVGKFLRQTRLDETPQLINILRGEMSLIGPRPERPELAAGIERKQPFFTERTYDVQPGLTGLAQINQSYLDSVDHIDTKQAYDHAYCLALSKPAVWLITDLRILVKTVFTVIKCNG